MAKPAGMVAALPWMIPAGFEAIRGLQHQDEAQRKISQMNAAWLQEQGIGANRSIHKILGAEEIPRLPLNTLQDRWRPVSSLEVSSRPEYFGVNELMRYLKGDPPLCRQRKKPWQRREVVYQRLWLSGF